MKYREKPVVIEAVKWTGFNYTEIEIFMGIELGRGSYGYTDFGANSCFIETLEGTMKTNPGDWIIKGIAGEFYPCKPDVFDATYEEIGIEDE